MSERGQRGTSWATQLSVGHTIQKKSKDTLVLKKSIKLVLKVNDKLII